MSSTEAAGRQSPAPEDSSNAQIGQVAGGQGTDNSDNKESTNKSDLDVSTSISICFPAFPSSGLHTVADNLQPGSLIKPQGCSGRRGQGKVYQDAGDADKRGG